MRLTWLLMPMWLACGAPLPCSSAPTFALEAGEPTGPLMRPGDNCLRCHSPSGEAASRPFSFGGTVFSALDASRCDGVAGVTVEVTDSKGTVVTAVSNEAGNVWSTTPLTPPLTMKARRAGREVVMPGNAPTGGCALCHSWPNAVSASGRIRAP